MDEEKENEGLVNKVGNELKKGAKNQSKKSIQKIIKKVIQIIAPILIKLVIVVLAVAIIVTAIADILEKIKSKNSKESSSFSVYYSDSASEEKSVANRIIVDRNNITADGAYLLKYEFKDKKGNILTEDEALANIKKEIEKQNESLDLKKFSDSELKIIGTLMYNGLKLEKYNTEQLKAVALFVKADIAANNFDLRSADKIGQEVSIEEMMENDYVYGTLQMHRTNAAQGYSSEQKLEYIPYGDESTPGTFCYMDKNLDTNIVNKFSINDEGQAVFAKWSTVNTTYEYLDESGNTLTESQIAEKISEDNIEESTNRTFISTTSFNYKKYIAKYVVNYGLLSDLLVATQNADFCLEIAQLSFNGKLVINIKEEYSVTDSTKITECTQTRLLYDFVSYNIDKNKTNTKTTEEKITSGSGDPKDSQNLKVKYGWSSEYQATISNEGAYGKTYAYTWKNSDKNYKLYVTVSNSSNYSWSLYEIKTDVTYEPIDKTTINNELISANKKVITDDYTSGDVYQYDESSVDYYTKKEIYKYTLKTIVHSESNSCSYEISEIDGWYIKYHKQYQSPVVETRTPSNTSSNLGEFSDEMLEVVNTTDVNEINTYQEVKEYLSNKEKTYNNANSGVVATYEPTQLIIKERSKTDENSTYSATTTKYKFGEEIADTTEVQIKNLEYVNGNPTYNKGNGEEIGFLYIYDKYIEDGIDLYLNNDAETRLFEMLEEDSSTQQYSNVLKFLLYVYDGIDRGTTTFKVKIIDIEAMNKAHGSSTSNYIKAWENGGLWAYERGDSTVFPTGYLSEDEMNYIVYEDGSPGHNNVAYGICTFISNGQTAYNKDWGYGYYNWVDAFANEGINVEEFYEGCLVDKEIVDSIYDNVVLKLFVDKVDNYLETNLPEYKFSKAQKNALIAICYQYGNISGFEDAYLGALNSDGSIDAEKIRSWSRFDYDGTINDRRYANWLLFTQGIYIDRSGNVISMGGSTIAEVIYEVTDHFLNSGVDVHYAGDSVSGSKHNHRSCRNGDIEASWNEPIEHPESVGIVCASMAAFAIWRAELIDAETINKYPYHSCGGIDSLLMNSEYADEWEIIPTYEELEEGDIVTMTGHTYIYMGDNMALDQNYCSIQSDGTDIRGQLININYCTNYRTEFIRGYRYIG